MEVQYRDDVNYKKEGRDVRLLSFYLQHQYQFFFVLIIQIVTYVHEELQY